MKTTTRRRIAELERAAGLDAETSGLVDAIIDYTGDAVTVRYLDTPAEQRRAWLDAKRIRPDCITILDATGLEP